MLWELSVHMEKESTEIKESSLEMSDVGIGNMGKQHHR